MRVGFFEKWNSYLDRFPSENKDIYFREEYVKLYETLETKALCVVCEDQEKLLLMPFLKRQINEYYDFETPYGYGGPISNVNDNVWIFEAMEEILAYLKKEKYLCGFIRFDVVLYNQCLCKSNVSVFLDRKTVIVNTDESIEDIWKYQITSKNRNMIRKGMKNELVFKAEYDFASMEEFKRLYNETMHRLKADSFYFFDDRYYQKIMEQMKGRAFLGTVRKDGKLLCAALFMYDQCYGHYHLEGSDHENMHFAANNFLLWNVIEEFHKNGIKKFHLGGGTDAQEDNSLLKFKMGFHKELNDFYIGKVILNQEEYDKIKSEWISKNPDKQSVYGNRVLCYRY